MSFDEGLGIFLWALLPVWAIVNIVGYRNGKRSLPMTAGFILVWIGIAADVPLPTVAPGLAFMHSKASILTTLGLLIILVSMLMERKKKAKSP